MMLAKGLRRTRLIVAALVLVWLSAPSSNAEPDDSREHLCVMNLDGTCLRRVAEEHKWPYFGSPRWSPDGKRIAVDSWEMPQGYHAARVWTLDAGGGNLTELGLGSMPDWSPDGTRLAFHVSPAGIWMMDADGTGREQFTTEGISPRFAPDGKSFAYSTAWPKIFDLAEGEAFRVSESGNCQGYCYSPDGAWLAGRNNSITQLPRVRRSPDGDMLAHENALTFIPTNPEDTREIRMWVGGDVGTHYDWSSDGKQIIFWMKTEERPMQQLYLVDVPDFDEPESVVAPRWIEGQDPTRHNMDMSFSPDGKQIVFICRPPPPELE